VARISLRDAASFAIGRHELSATRSGAGAADAAAVARRTLGLHAPLLSSAALSVVVRTAGYDRERFESDLYRDRSVVKVWCMRGTLHVLSRDDYTLFLHAVLRPRGEGFRRFLSRCGFTPGEIDALPARVERALADGPLTRAELHGRVPELTRIPFPEWGQDVKDLCYLGVLVHAEPSGSRARFALSKDWLGFDATLLPVPREEARAELMKRYLRAYGPASASDFAYWAGLESVAGAVDARMRLGEEVVEVQVEGYRSPLLAMAGDVPELSRPSPPPRPFVLPRFDPLMLGYRDRRRFVDEDWRQKLVLPGGFVAGTIWSQGRIAGTWDYRVSGKRLDIEIEAFRPLTAADKEALAESLRPAAAAIGAESVRIHWTGT
jgi:hypothetical protein